MYEDKIRVATFNFMNLKIAEKGIHKDPLLNKEEFEKKKSWINGQLNLMDADIIGFQELFHEEALRDILNDNPKYHNAYLTVGHNKKGLPSVGLISRFPITDIHIINEFPDDLEIDGIVMPFKEFSRPVVKCRVQVRPDLYFIVVVAHLKSKRPKFSEGADKEDPLEIAKGSARSLLYRAMEAQALRTVLMDVLKDRNCPVIVMGDLNDTHTSVTTRIISGDQPQRNLPHEAKKAIWDTILYHVKDIQARLSYTDTYYTHIYNGHYESLDHIMVSQELVSQNPKHIGKVGYVRVFNDHLIDETLSGENVPSWTSDHAQVMVSIELKQ